MQAKKNLKVKHIFDPRMDQNVSSNLNFKKNVIVKKIRNSIFWLFSSTWLDH